MKRIDEYVYNLINEIDGLKEKDNDHITLPLSLISDKAKREDHIIELADHFVSKIKMACSENGEVNIEYSCDNLVDIISLVIGITSGLLNDCFQFDKLKHLYYITEFSDEVAWFCKYVISTEPLFDENMIFSYKEINMISDLKVKCPFIDNYEISYYDYARGPVIRIYTNKKKKSKNVFIHIFVGSKIKIVKDSSGKLKHIEISTSGASPFYKFANGNLEDSQNQ